MKIISKILFFIFVIIPAIAITAAIIIFQQVSASSICAHESLTVSKILPTCKSEGYTTHICKDCDYSYVTDIVPPTPHDYTAYTIPPTCSVEGYVIYLCSCGDSYKGETIPTVEHEFKSKTVLPTCSSEGYDEHICEICGYSYQDCVIPSTEHEFKKSVYRPTALSDGFTVYECECSESYVDEYISYDEILSSPYLEESSVLYQGIDVSRWNHQIDVISGEYLPLDWKLIKDSGFDFVILKIGSTRSGKEPTFEIDYEGAKSAGLMVGAYYYTYSTDEDGIEKDVSSVLEYLDGKTFEFPIYFDIEDPTLIPLGKERLTELCEIFICSLQENGYYSALYTNNNWLTNLLDTSRILSLFDIWYARYPEVDAPVWNEEKYGEQLSMWQYTQSGEIEGIEGFFDMNFCYRDYLSIMKKWGLNGFRAEEHELSE